MILLGNLRVTLRYTLSRQLRVPWGLLGWLRVWTWLVRRRLILVRVVLEHPRDVSVDIIHFSFRHYQNIYIL